MYAFLVTFVLHTAPFDTGEAPTVIITSQGTVDRSNLEYVTLPSGSMVTCRVCQVCIPL